MMPLARMHKQRQVQRGTWKPRFTKQKVNWRGTTKFTAPTLTSISPSTAVKGGADLTMTCTGTGFVAGVTRIVFNGGDEPTTVVGPTSCTTIVKPSLVSVAGAYPVEVRNGPLRTAPQTFTFTAAMADPQSGSFDPSDPGAHTVAEVQAWVDDHPDSADEVLAAEQARPSPRVTLVDWLTGFIAHRDEP